MDAIDKNIEQIIGELDLYLGELSNEGLFSGVVLISKGAKTFLKKGYGFANMNFSIRNQPHMKYHIGSMTKIFTAISIAQLVERGKVSFNDPIKLYLPNFPNPSLLDSIKVHHLLTHTSGLTHYLMNEKYSSHFLKIREIKDYNPLFDHEKLLFTPGFTFSYSNTGYILLGQIIENMTNLSYHDYVKENIFDIAEMNDSSFATLDEIISDLAVGYTNVENYSEDVSTGQFKEGKLKNNSLSIPVKGAPDGNSISTLDDLLKFSHALQGNFLLSVEQTKNITTGKFNLGSKKFDNMEYGYGCFIRENGGKRCFGHGGDAPGTHSSLDIFPELGYTSIVLSNNDILHGKPRVEDRIREALMTLTK